MPTYLDSSHRMVLRALSGFAVAFATTVVAVVPAGCDDDAGSTTGRRIVLDVKIAASPESKQFTNAVGWNVSLTKAAIATGAFYFYDGDTLFAHHRRAPTWSLVAPAFAHPGHYVPGNANGEMRTPSSADLLAGAVLGAGEGVSGFARSATFAFSSPAVGPMASELGSNVAVIEGVATKGGETRAFRAEVRPDEVRGTHGKPEVEGCPFTAVDMQADGVVTIEVKVPMWLDHVAFDEITASADGRPVLVVDGLAKNQLVRGMKGGLAYQFSYFPR